jgi:hypothetical protein
MSSYYGKIVIILVAILQGLVTAEEKQNLPDVFAKYKVLHQSYVSKSSFPWANATTLHLVGTCKEISEGVLVRVLQNIAFVMSYWGSKSHFFVYTADRNSSILFENLNDARVHVIEGTHNSNARTERLALGRNTLLSAVSKHVKNGTENADTVYVAFMDLDDVCTNPFNKQVFEAVMEAQRLWDVVSFYRRDYYDIWALRYPRYDVNVYTAAIGYNHTLIGIIRRDIETELSKLKSSFYPVFSAFNGFAIYRFKHTRGCHYIGHETLADGKKIDDCEHAAFHKCMISKHKSRIMIYSNSLI